VIDMSNGNSQEVAEQITKASQEWGFLLLKNHGIATADVDEMFALAYQFFVGVPENKKQLFPITSDYVGYMGSLKDRYKDDKSSMWLSGSRGFLTENLQILPPFWRTQAEKVEKFKHDCFLLIRRLLVYFAMAMGLPDHEHFARAHQEDAGKGNRFRLNHYPARATAPDEATTRMSAHSDSGSITLLFQTCEGLEVESPTGEWFLTPHIPEHILVNLGDALAFWSGRWLKATKHRVTFKGVPHDRERMTMAYFALASPETVLEPV
ncbi:hypothetical protein M433DRAFT_54823, partial [Acidomyces richmondensis BFW]